jgi:tetratricopeptide (TPR) repeat protein
MSDHDRFLADLGRSVRDEDGLDDPAWDALAAGELSPEQSAELASRAPVHGAEERPFDVLRPLDATERTNIADAVLARLDAEGPSVAPPAREARVISLPARKPAVRVLGWLGLAAALAAGVWLAGRDKSDAPELAAYHLRASGGDTTHLGAPDAGELRLAPGSRVSFRIEPETPVDGALGVEAFLVAEGKARPWNAPILRRSGGVLVVEGTREALFEGVEDGHFEVVFVLGRPEKMTSTEALSALAEGHAEEVTPGLRVLRVPVWLVPGKGTRRDLAPPRIEVGGCDATTSGCELRGNQELVIWTETSAVEDASITVDGQTLSLPSVSIEGGRRVRLATPNGAVEVGVTARKRGREARLTVSLTPPAAVPALVAARAAAQRGDLAEAELRLAEVEREASPAVRLQAKRQRARLALRRGAPEAAAALRQTLDEAHQLGRTADEMNDRFALAYHLLFDARQLGPARGILEGAQISGPLAAESEVARDYFLGLLAMETGDLRTAIPKLSASAAGAARLGQDDQRGAALEVLSEALVTLGRDAESASAAEQARALLPEDAEPCERVRGLSNFGWALLRAGGGAKQRDDALQEAQALAATKCPAELGHVLTNIAVAEHSSGHTERARQALSAARAATETPEPRDAEWWLAIEGRLALAEGRPAEAQDAFDALQALGEAAALPRAVFEGRLGRAEVLVARGDEPAARVAFDAANQALSQWAAFVPLGEGREGFLRAHSCVAEAELGALVAWSGRSGDPDGARREALHAASRAASRAVAAWAGLSAVERLPETQRTLWLEAVGRYRAQRVVVEERAAGLAGGPSSELDAARSALQRELESAFALLGPQEATSRTKEAPSSPPAGEIQLAFASLGVSWITLAATLAETWAEPIPRSSGRPPREVLERASVSLRQALARATRVRVVSDGPGSGIDVHALELAGVPLLATHTVTYGLDVGAPSSARPVAARVAVVVVDPTRDAPAIRATADGTAVELGRAGFAVERIEGENATHEALRDALERPEVDLFYYAGHAVYEGLAGSLAGLHVAAEGRLTVSDILALERVPRQVVLLACEGGRTETGSATGLGVAQAFVLRGAEIAIAATRPVEDAMAARLGVALSRELGAGKPPSDALASSQAALYEDQPAELERPDGWGAFRAWVR